MNINTMTIKKGYRKLTIERSHDVYIVVDSMYKGTSVKTKEQILEIIAAML